MQKQKGVVEIVLVLLLVAALGAAGYFWWQRGMFVSLVKYGVVSPSKTPSLLPTQTRKGVLAYKDPKGSLMVMDLDNDTKQTISTQCKNDKERLIEEIDYQWTVDGKRLIIFCNGGNWYEYNILNKDLKTLGINGDNLTAGWRLQLSKDGDGVFFTNEQKTWLVDLSSGTKTDLFTEQAVQLSPDEERAIIVRKGGQKDKFGNLIEKFYVLDIASKKETEIIPPNNSQVENPFLMDFNWAQDGNTIAYVYVTNIPYSDKNPGVGNRRHVAFYDLSLKQSREIGLPVLGAWHPVFSPNGQYIYFEAEDPFDLMTHQSLWIMKISDGSTKKLFEVVDFYYYPDVPSWSSDSLYIAASPAGKNEIYIININNGEAKILTGHFPMFSPSMAGINTK